MPRVRVALVALVVVLAGCAAPSAAPPRASVESCLGLEEFGEQLDCLAPVLERAVIERRVVQVFDELSQAQRDGRLDDCHMIAHHLGHEAYDFLGNLSLALQSGDARCVKAYYHGVMERALQARADLPIVALCDVVRENASQWDGCVHGLGHGLMWRSQNNLEASIVECGVLAPSDGRSRCVSGALMENSLRFVASNESEYVLFAPYVCGGHPTLDRSLLLDCYFEMGIVAMLHYRHDLDKALALCASADSDEGARAACEDGARFEGSAAREAASL